MSEDQKAAYAAEMLEVSGQSPVETAKPAEKVEVESEVKVDPVANADDSATFDINTLPPAAKQLLEAERKKAAEIEDRYREADRDRRSLRGRIPHLEKKLAQWENDRNRAAQSPRVQKPTAVQTPVKPTASEPLPGLGNLRKVFGEDAAPIEEAITSLVTTNKAQAERLEEQGAQLAKLLERLDNEVTPRIKDVDNLRAEREELQYRTVEKEVYEARDNLAKNYPDWRTHIRHTYDPETNEITQTHVSDAMKGWLDAMPERHQQFYEDVLFEGGPKEVEKVIEQFYREVVNANADQAKQQQAADTLKARQEALGKRSVTTSNGAALNAEGKLSDAERYKRDMQAQFN